MLTVFNCGQGDASIFDHPGLERPFVIDLGPTGFEFPEYFPNKIDLLITHSHSDHIGGRLSSFYEVNTLYIPAYFPEILKIYQKLLKTKLLPPFKFNNVKILHEGVTLTHRNSCLKTKILNPPLNPELIFKNVKKKKLEISNNDISKFLTKYNTTIEDILKEETYLDKIDNISNIPDGYSAETFVRLSVGMIAHMMLGKRAKIEKVFARFLEYDANKISIVSLHTGCSIQPILMTGDADKSVFNRLIKKGSSIKANILKVPHHGSKKSIGYRILTKIDPQIAIVSHNNGLFGKAKDPHPNKEVINALNRLKIKTYYTNDVIKDGKVIVPAYRGCVCSRLVKII